MQGKIWHDVQSLYGSMKVSNVSFDVSESDPVAVSGSREVLQVARESTGTWRVDLTSGSYHTRYLSGHASVNAVDGTHHTAQVVPVGDGRDVGQYRVYVLEGTSGSLSDATDATSPRVSLSIWHRNRGEDL